MAPLLPKLLTTEVDLAVVTAKGERSIDLLSNDSFAATAPCARITHVAGQAISEGQTITLASGERITLLEDGTIRIEATATSGSTDVTYLVTDGEGGYGEGTLHIVTAPVDGTEGNDHMVLGYSDAQGQMIDGSDGASEVILGYGGDDKIFSGGGNDEVHGGTGNDFIRAEAGNDLIVGGDGNDVLDGGLGADTLQGGAGDDVYWIDEAGDVISDVAGGGHDKVLSGISHVLGADFEELWLNEGSAATHGTGNETANKIVGNANFNILLGLDGNDQIFGEAGEDRLEGGAGNDNLFGGSGLDALFGGDGSDKLYGGAGADTLSGGAGNDSLSADDGGDRLIGGTGTDLLSGAAGNDVFVFAQGDGRDTVKNFQNGIDLIEFAGLSFADLTIRGIGSTVQITDGFGDCVILSNTLLVDIDATDFLFT